MTDITEFTATEKPLDIRTSQLPMRVVEDDDGSLRMYPAVQLDTPVDDAKQGRSRKFKSEPIALSDGMANFLLMSIYGPTEAASMLYRAGTGQYVFGRQLDQEGDGYRWKVGWNVASDKSREAGFVVQCIGFRTHGKGYRKPAGESQG